MTTKITAQHNKQQYNATPHHHSTTKPRQKPQHKKQQNTTQHSIITAQIKLHQAQPKNTWSLPKATMEPVAVAPPMKEARYTALIRTASAVAAGSFMCSI